MDACSSLLAAPSYGLGAAGAFDACTPSPAPSEAARRALLSGWPNYPTVSDTTPTMLGHRAPPTFSPYTPGSGVAAPPYGSAFADIAAFGPPPPQRSNLSAFYPGTNAGSGGCSTGDVYGAAYPNPHHHPSQHGAQQHQPGSAQHHVHPASSAAVAAALHGSRLLLSDLQTAAAAVGAMPPPPLSNSRYDSVDPLCYLNDVVAGSTSLNAGNTRHCRLKSTRCVDLCSAQDDKYLVLKALRHGSHSLTGKQHHACLGVVFQNFNSHRILQ